jgi:iron uptake system EfeUOB component EfeO/EfeM
VIVSSRPVASALTAAVAASVGCFAAIVPALPAQASTTARGSRQTAAIERNLATSATENYELAIRSGAGTLDTDTQALAEAVAAGDTALAEYDELAAQSAYDAVGQVLDENVAAAEAFDGLAADAGGGDSFSGLHLVEQDLWGGGNPGPAVAALETEAPVVALIPSRVRLGPPAIVTVGVNALGWVNDEVVTQDEEAYSHLDTIDAVAGVAAARTAFAMVAPLGRLAAPGATRAVVEQFGRLEARVEALGTEGTRVDDEIAPSTWLALAQQVDATAAALSTLAGDLAHFSAGGTYG